MTEYPTAVINTKRVDDIQWLCDKLGYNLIIETKNLPQIYTVAEIDKKHRTIYLRYSRKDVLPHGVSRILAALQFYGEIEIIRWEYDETCETGCVSISVKEAKE
jgi:hypothetical protein